MTGCAVLILIMIYKSTMETPIKLTKPGEMRDAGSSVNVDTEEKECI